MRLEHHDDKYNDPIKSPRQNSPTHCADNEVDYDYQAEQWVQECAKDYAWEVRWVLYDDFGQRAIWVKTSTGPVLVAKAPRFQGQWVPVPGFLWLP